MTAQAHEILILEGQKTSMACCPPLPENEPRITKSAQTMLSSACWRGYIGTWEIKQGRLFLVGLSGNYNLGEGEPIFADWFSGEITIPEGEILNYIHGGFATVYEREQRIHIERGVVVKAIEVSNRPTHQDASEIKKFVESRGIMSLLHFTRVANVPEILKHGLLGRESIVTRGLSASFNDQYRYDNAADSVCASISFPNYKMFYSLQQRSLDDDWVVLRLNPKILWEIPCAYCFSNAASSKVTKIPIEERMRFKALASMFEDIPPSIMRSSLGIPDEYTTDPQAEVLVLAPVDPSYILDINVNQKNKIKDMETMQNLFKPFSNRFKFQHDGSLFTYRKDYEYWRRDQFSSDDLSIDFEDIFDI